MDSLGKVDSCGGCTIHAGHIHSFHVTALGSPTLTVAESCFSLWLGPWEEG